MALSLHDPATFGGGFPHDTFQRLRDEAPLVHVDHPGWPDGCWAIVRHAELQRVSRDASRFSNAPHPFIDADAGGEGSGMSELLISQDPPTHTKLRKLISKGFTPRRVTDLTERIERHVAALLDDLRDGRSADLVDDVASWLPLHVIADLVGVPEEDRRQVFEWTELTFGFDPSVTQQERAEAAVQMYAYADGLCEARREQPADDLMSVLLDAEVDGERLTQLQIDLFFLLLQNAGSETTRNLVTTGTLVLLQHPDQLEALRADLSLLPVAIEELLRWVSPVMQFTRRVVTDTEVGGQHLAAGEHVVLVYPSANRDERAFPEPFRLDIRRRPNDHVAFGGGGAHHCLGASLARLEAKVAFEAILTRFDGLELDASEDELPRVHSNLIDGFSHMPIRWKELR